MARAAERKKVVGVGLAVLDHLLLWRSAQEPVAGNRIVQVDTQGGGMIGTALVAVTRLGGAAELWTAVGTDWAGDMILQGLRRENVETSQVRRVEGRRGPTVVVCVDQPTGERHFLHFTGAVGWAGTLGSPARLKDAGCVLVDHSQPEAELHAAREARRLGIPVVGDLGRIDEDAADILGHMDCAIVSEACARALTDGDDLRGACERIRSMGPPRVVVTLGERGLVCLDGDDFGEMPAFAVDVVDTTGAGDVFHGAFCWGLIEGLDMQANLRFASAAAAIKCTRLGGRAGIPTRDDVLRFLKERNGRSQEGTRPG
jgi:sulfofructose kinase